ncbi:MAG: hypothetical protein WCF84_13590 [Anaerolineae bacterium]
MRTLLRSTFRVSSRHWVNALIWLTWNALGTFFPLWGLLTILFFVKSNQRFITWATFAGRGEFFLYSAAMLSGAIYVMGRRGGLPKSIASIVGIKETDLDSNRQFPGFHLFLIIDVSLLVFSTIMFALATELAITPNPGELDQDAFIWASIIVLGITLFMSYLITVIDNSRSDPNEEDVKKLLKQPPEDLRAKFNDLVDKAQPKGN